MSSKKEAACFCVRPIQFYLDSFLGFVEAWSEGMEKEGGGGGGGGGEKNGKDEVT